MARPTLRQTPRLEALESREVMSSGGPSAQAQYMLEQINFARTNPVAAAEKYSTNLDADTLGSIAYYNLDLNAAKAAIANSPARQPLAWSDDIGAAAQGQSNDQAANGYQGHQGSDGSNLATRMARAGVKNVTNAAENAFAYSKSLDQAMEAFLLDWGVADSGHRKNMLQPTANDDNSFNQVGIGVTGASKNGTGPLVVVQDFARVNNKPADLLGVAYDDTNKDGAYSLGEGKGDVTITARNISTGAEASVDTWDAGGYQIPLTPGTYDVTAKVGNRVVRTQRAAIGTQNVKIDFRLSDPWQENVPAPAPVVATPPAVTPKPSTPPVVVIPKQLSFSAPVQATNATPTVSITQSTPPTNANASGMPDGFNVNWISNWTWQGKANTK
jgi:uncharacterized protein YkwD